MAIGPGEPRFAPSELDLDKSLRSRRRGARLMRRTGDGWTEIQRFGSISEARPALDEQVGKGLGDASEYAAVPLPHSRWFPIGVAAMTVGLVLTLALIVAFLLS